jgi:hypothetical protein
MASGRLTSPNYPNFYDHNSTCTTVIVAPDDAQVLLVFRDFRVERGRRQLRYRPLQLTSSGLGGGLRTYDHIARLYTNLQVPSPTDSVKPSNCIYDSLSIFYNNSDPSQFEKLCGTALPQSILTTQNSATLFLQTDFSMAFGGYDMYYYTAVPQARDEASDQTTFYEFATMKEKQGALTNIGYPGYPPKTFQRWTIIPPVGQECKVRVTTIDFTANNDELCSRGDHARSASVLAAKKDTLNFNALEWSIWPCKLEAPLEENVPTAHMMIIEFVTDGDTTNDGTGFRLSWDCADFTTQQV